MDVEPEIRGGLLVKNKKLPPMASLPGVGGLLLDLPDMGFCGNLFSYGNFIAKYLICK